MINFYDFINFYTFYYDYFQISCDYSKHFDSVRRLRNASAHNICMLCSFKPVQSFKYDVATSFELLQSSIGIGNGVISSCMKIPLLNDFTVMLSVYTKLITSPKIKEKTLKEITTQNLQDHFKEFCKFCGNFKDYAPNHGDFIPRCEKAPFKEKISPSWKRIYNEYKK